MRKFFCALSLLALIVQASTSLGGIPDDVFHRIINMTVLFSFNSITTLPLVSHRFSHVVSFQYLIHSSDPFVASYVNIVKQQWNNGQSSPISDFNLRWGDVTRQHAFLARVIESAETGCHLPAETVGFLCTVLTSDLLKVPEGQGIKLLGSILSSRPPYTEMTDKGKERVLKAMANVGSATRDFLYRFERRARGVLPEAYEAAVRVMVSGKNVGLFAKLLTLSMALDFLVVAGRLDLPEAGKVLFQVSCRDDFEKLASAVSAVLADDNFGGEKSPEREQYKDQLTTAIFKFALLPVTPYQQLFSIFRNKNPHEFLDFCIKNPQLPLGCVPSCLALKLLALHCCKRGNLEEVPRTAGVDLVGGSFSSLQLSPLICNTGWVRELELSEDDRATVIRSLDIVSEILWALDSIQNGRQEARDFVYEHFSHDEFVPFEQHYEFWMAMAKHVREDEKEKLLAQLDDIVNQYPSEFPDFLLPLQIVLHGELREEWSVDEIEAIVRTLGKTRLLFSEDQINILCTLLITTDPSIIAHTVFTTFLPITNEAGARVSGNIFWILAKSPHCDHVISNLLLQAINFPSVTSPIPYLPRLLHSVDSLKRRALFGKVLTRCLPGFTSLSDKQINDALDVFKAANAVTFSWAEIFEMPALLDALTAGDERAIGILMGRSDWKWDVEYGYCPEAWLDDPAKRQETLLALKALHQERTRQQPFLPQNQPGTDGMG